MPRLNTLIIALCIAMNGIAVASAQSPRLPSSISQTQGTGSVPVTNGDDAQKQQAIAANQQRQIEIRRDMEKMTELTQELKDYLEKTDQGVMSLDAIKKAEQIEKLAHSVKSKMKQSF
jgi:glutamine synthetase type III